MAWAHELGRRWVSLLVVAAVAVAVTVRPPYRNGAPIRSDGVGYHIWTRALLDADLSFRRYANLPGVYPVNAKGTAFANQYPPGLALLRFPVMAPLVDRRPGAPPVGAAEHRACQVLALLALLGVCWLSLRTCHLLGVDAAAAHGVVLAGVFGAGLFHYGTYDGCFTHVYSALGVALLLWMGVRAIVSGRDRLPWLPVAVTSFFLVSIRNTNVLALAGLATAYVTCRLRANIVSPRALIGDLTAAGTGTLFAAAMQLGYNAYAQGHPTLSSYGSEPFLWDRPMFRSVLLSYERGLFSYFPVLGVALAAAFWARATRHAAAWFTALLLAYAALYGYWWSWMLGSGFGHRGFVELMPIGIVLSATALAQLPKRARVALGVCALLCTGLTVRFMLAYWKGSLPMAGTTASLYWAHACGSRSAFGFLFR